MFRYSLHEDHQLTLGAEGSLLGIVRIRKEKRRAFVLGNGSYQEVGVLALILRRHNHPITPIDGDHILREAIGLKICKQLGLDLG